MIRRRIIGTSAALAILGSAALLVSGHPLLDWPATGLPLGTLLAGVLVSGLGALPLAIAPRSGRVRRLCVGVFALSLAWLPMSLLLAGNLRLNFSSGSRSEWAAALGTATATIMIVGGAIATLARVLARRSTR